MFANLWSRYKAALNVKQDLHDIFIRPHARYATLDGARAITVLLMVQFHVLFGVVWLLKDNFVHLDGFLTTFPRYLGWMWQSQGSDPLFVMCGLLVAYTLYREFDRSGKIDVKRFYKRRIMRVYPLFLIALLLYLLTDIDSIFHLLSNLIFLSNYIPEQRHIIPVGWSLDVQMQFYFMLPAIIYLLYKTPYRITFLTGLFLASVAWRYYIVARNPEVWQSPFYRIIYDNDFGSLLANELYYDLDVRIGCFFIGMLVAYLHYYHKKPIQAFFERHLVTTALLTLLGFSMIVVALCLPIENRYHSFYDNFNAQLNFWFLVVDRYLYTVGLSLLLIIALCPAGLGRVLDWILSWKIWHPVAQLIFPIYLFHFPFVIFGAVFTFWTLDPDAITTVATWQVFSIFFWTLVFTMAFSTLTHVYVEKPFINMREPDGVKDHSALPNVIATHKA